jgi:hypothetical protein
MVGGRLSFVVERIDGDPRRSFVTHVLRMRSSGGLEDRGRPDDVSGGLAEVPEPRAIAGGLRCSGFGSADGLRLIAATEQQAPCNKKNCVSVVD